MGALLFRGRCSPILQGLAGWRNRNGNWLHVCLLLLLLLFCSVLCYCASLLCCSASINYGPAQPSPARPGPMLCGSDCHLIKHENTDRRERSGKTVRFGPAESWSALKAHASFIGTFASFVATECENPPPKIDFATARMTGTLEFVVFRLNADMILDPRNRVLMLRCPTHRGLGQNRFQLVKAARLASLQQIITKLQRDKFGQQTQWKAISSGCAASSNNKDNNAI